MSYDRISPLVPKENIIIVTNSHYAPLVKEQLPELNDDQILLEPPVETQHPALPGPPTTSQPATLRHQ